jgi:hypothetical protein
MSSTPSMLPREGARVCAYTVPNVERQTHRVHVLAVGLAALALAAPAAAHNGTLRGTVHRGPLRPVCHVGTPCNAPAKRVTILFRRGGKTIRVRTDAAGRYRTALAAGTWNVALASRAVGTSIAPTHVRVRAGATRTVDLSIDSGLR